MSRDYEKALAIIEEANRHALLYGPERLYYLMNSFRPTIEAMKAHSEKTAKCALCGRQKADHVRMFDGQDGAICYACVRKCYDAMDLDEAYDSSVPSPEVSSLIN